MLKSALLAVAAGAFVALAATGCTSQSTLHVKATPSAKPDSFAGQLPPQADPLQDYAQSPAMLIAMTRAEDILANKCMKKFGFDGYQAHDYDALAKSFAVDDSRLYGITDATKAATYGFMPAPSITQARPSEEGTPSYRFVLLGLKPGQKPTDDSTSRSQGKVSGVAIPLGGCLGQARLELTGNLTDEPPKEATLGHELDDKAWFDAWNDPITEAAKARWAECMAKAGYKVLDPLDDIPMQKQSKATLSEIQQALADISCKKSVNFVAMANAENVRVATQYLEENQLALQASKMFNENVLKRANEAISAR